MNSMSFDFLYLGMI